MQPQVALRTIGIAFEKVHIGAAAAEAIFMTMWNYMRQFDKPMSVSDELAGDFTRSFEFAPEKDLLKTVTVSRHIRRILIEIRYMEGAVTDETDESFEADGPIRISLMDDGLYLTATCMLLAGRVGLRRTRYF